VTGTEQKPTLPEGLDAMAVTGSNLPKPKTSSVRTTTARSKQRAERPTLSYERRHQRQLPPDTGAPSEEQLKREQEDDPECVEIMDYRT
jgi:hypothetical protein